MNRGRRLCRRPRCEERLKAQTRADLHGAAGNSHTIDGRRAANYRAIDDRKLIGRQSEAGMIECVLRIPTNLQLNLLPNCKSLAKGYVCCGETRSSELIPMHIGEGSRSWRCDGGHVERMLDTATCRRRMTDEI